MIAEMMALARRTIVVADSAKLEGRAFAIVAPLERVDILVTDRAPPATLQAALDRAGVTVVVAPAD
jgi:DeoR/GlpR family transcriptional regulator of sugar metabolism